MKVKELAVKLNISSELIITTLKSLKLKAKDDEQELSAGVVSVIKSELVKPKKPPKKDSDKPKAAKKKVEKPDKEEKKKEEEKIAEEKPQKKEEEKKVVVIEKPLPSPEVKVQAKPVEPISVKKVVKDEIRTSVVPPVAPPPKVPPKIIEQVLTKKITKPFSDRDREKMKQGPMIILKPLARKKKKMTKSFS
ncbi:MAG: hypothetical protein HQL27_06050, partial [Candidatus Omnitrophica bacterium]|nr:hypothetical protein [Candidatus Omnitrophota bacterium]